MDKKTLENEILREAVKVTHEKVYDPPRRCKLLLKIASAVLPIRTDQLIFPATKKLYKKSIGALKFEE